MRRTSDLTDTATTPLAAAVRFTRRLSGLKSALPVALVATLVAAGFAPLLSPASLRLMPITTGHTITTGRQPRDQLCIGGDDSRPESAQTLAHVGPRPAISVRQCLEQERDGRVQPYRVPLSQHPQVFQRLDVQPARQRRPPGCLSGRQPTWPSVPTGRHRRRFGCTYIAGIDWANIYGTFNAQLQVNLNTATSIDGSPTCPTPSSARRP